MVAKTTQPFVRPESSNADPRTRMDYVPSEFERKAGSGTFHINRVSAAWFFQARLVAGGVESIPGFHTRLAVKLLRAHDGCLGVRRR